MDEEANLQTKQPMPGPTDPNEERPMSELRQQVALSEYQVDSQQLAEAILRKLHLVRHARRELGDAGQSRLPRAPALPPRAA